MFAHSDDDDGGGGDDVFAAQTSTPRKLSSPLSDRDSQSCDRAVRMTRRITAQGVTVERSLPTSLGAGGSPDDGNVSTGRLSSVGARRASSVVHVPVGGGSGGGAPPPPPMSLATRLDGWPSDVSSNVSSLCASARSSGCTPRFEVDVSTLLARRRSSQGCGLGRLEVQTTGSRRASAPISGGSRRLSGEPASGSRRLGGESGRRSASGSLPPSSSSRGTSGGSMMRTPMPMRMSLASRRDGWPSDVSSNPSALSASSGGCSFSSIPENAACHRNSAVEGGGGAVVAPGADEEAGGLAAVATRGNLAHLPPPADDSIRSVGFRSPRNDEIDLNATGYASLTVGRRRSIEVGGGGGCGGGGGGGGGGGAGDLGGLSFPRSGSLASASRRRASAAVSTSFPRGGPLAGGNRRRSSAAQQAQQVASLIQGIVLKREVSEMGANIDPSVLDETVEALTLANAFLSDHVDINKVIEAAHKQARASAHHPLTSRATHATPTSTTPPTPTNSYNSYQLHQLLPTTCTHSPRSLSRSTPQTPHAGALRLVGRAARNLLAADGAAHACRVRRARRAEPGALRARLPSAVWLVGPHRHRHLRLVRLVVRHARMPAWSSIPGHQQIRALLRCLSLDLLILTRSRLTPDLLILTGRLLHAATHRPRSSRCRPSATAWARCCGCSNPIPN